MSAKRPDCSQKSTKDEFARLPVILRALCCNIKRTTQLKKFFVFGILAVVTAGTTGLGLWKLADDRNANSPDEILSLGIAKADAKISDDLQIHVDALAKDGCASQVKQLKILNAEQPIENASQIPSALRSDLALCIGRGVMLNYVKGQLKDAGLWAMLQPAVS